MKSVAALLLLLGCGCAQADVYKWTDERGEVHFDEHPPASAVAEKVMTQQQVDADERAGPADPPPAESAGGPGLDPAEQERLQECQRFKTLRDGLLMDMDRPGQSLAPLAGYGAGYVARDNEANSGVMGFEEIQANIRKYCQE